MSLKNDLQNIYNCKNDIKLAIENKLNNTIDNDLFNYANYINSINVGTDTSDANAISADILSLKTAYVNGVKITGNMTNLGDLSIFPNTTGGTYNAGYVNSINISAVTSSIDSSITCNNILNGVNILGVVGNAEPLQYRIKCQTKQLDWDLDKMNNLNSIPYDMYYGSASTIINNDVYLFGGDGGNKLAYRYNIDTDTYTQLKNIPQPFVSGEVVAVGTDIYLIGGSTNSNPYYIDKYNILTNSYINNYYPTPYGFYGGVALAIGTDIYMFGTEKYDYEKQAAKYNTVTNTSSSLRQLPIKFYSGVGAIYNNDIYLFAGGFACKYNITSNIYTNLNTPAFSLAAGSASVIDSNIYIFGGNYNRKVAHKYDINNDVYIQLNDIPYNFYYGVSESKGDEIYLFGGYDSKNKVGVFNTKLLPSPKQGLWIESNDFTYDTIEEIYNTNNLSPNAISFLVDDNQLNYKTQLINSVPLNYSFSKVYLTDNTCNIMLDTPNVYYGNGVEWINITNPSVVLTPEEAVEANSTLDEILGQEDQGDTDNLTPEEDIEANEIADDILGNE